VNGPFETEQDVLALPAVREILEALRQVTHKRGVTGEQANFQLLTDALAAAGVELGAYDQRVLGWLCGWEVTTVAVVAAWVTRAAGDVR
jgi:hypothetical protein